MHGEGLVRFDLRGELLSGTSRVFCALTSENATGKHGELNGHGHARFAILRLKQISCNQIRARRSVELYPADRISIGASLIDAHVESLCNGS